MIETEDPSIAMRTIRVVFVKAKHNYKTSINGTRKEIADYFRGARLDVGSGGIEVMESPVAIEFLDNDEIIRVEL